MADVWKLDVATWHQSIDGGTGEWNYVVSVPASDETEFDWGVGAACQSTPSSQLDFDFALYSAGDPTERAGALAQVVVRDLDDLDATEIVYHTGTYQHVTDSIANSVSCVDPQINSTPSLKTMTAVLNQKELSSLGSFSTRQIQAHRTFVFTNADEDTANHANAKASISVAKYGSALLEHETAIEMHHDTDSVMQVSVKGDLTVDGALKYASVVATGGSTFDGGIVVNGQAGATIAHGLTAKSVSASEASAFDHIDCASLTSTGKIIAFHDIESKADDGTIGNGSNGMMRAKNGHFEYLNCTTGKFKAAADVEVQGSVRLLGDSSTFLSASNANVIFANGYLRVGATELTENQCKLNAADGKITCKNLETLAGVTAAGALAVTGTARVDGHVTLGVDGEETGNLRVGGTSQFDAQTTHVEGIVSNGDITAASKTVSCGTVDCDTLKAGTTTLGATTISGMTNCQTLAASGNVSGANLNTDGAVNAVSLNLSGGAIMHGSLQCSTLNVTGDTTTISSSEVVIADRSLTIGNDETADQTEAAARSAAVAAGGMEVAFGQFTNADSAVQQFGGSIKYEMDALSKDKDRFVFNNALRCEGDLSFGSRVAPGARMVWRYRTGAHKASPSDKSTVELWLVTSEVAGYEPPNRMIAQFHDHGETV